MQSESHEDQPFQFPNRRTDLAQSTLVGDPTASERDGQEFELQWSSLIQSMWSCWDCPKKEPTSRIDEICSSIPVVRIRGRRGCLIARMVWSHDIGHRRPGPWGMRVLFRWLLLAGRR